MRVILMSKGKEMAFGIFRVCVEIEKALEIGKMFSRNHIDIGEGHEI